MRILAVLLLSAAAGAAFAQSTARERPPGTIPLDEPPPPPPLVQSDPSLEPQTSIRTDGEGQTVEEFRANGRVLWERVTPRNGRPYVVMHDRADGTNTRQENTLDVLRVPQWVLLEF